MKAGVLSNPLSIEVQESHPLAVYEQIRDQIREHIVSEQLPENTPLPSVRALAEIAGVSLRTAHRAVLELAKEGTCYNKRNRGIFVGRKRESRTQRKACCIYSGGGRGRLENDMVLMHLYKGIQACASRDHIDTIFLSRLAEQDIAFYLQSTDLDVTGIIMLGLETFSEGQELAEMFPAAPFVFLNYHIKGFEKTPDNMHGIFNDDFAGGYQATEWLINRGHRDIAAFALELRDENYHRRIEGYRKALSVNGIIGHEDRVCFATTKGGVTLEEIGSNFTERVLSRTPTPTAIFCVNDRIAVGVIRRLREAGKDEDIEVVGYDNSVPHLGHDYGFSTVHVDFEGMGELAVERLWAQRGDFPKILHLTPRMIVREPALVTAGRRVTNRE